MIGCAACKSNLRVEIASSFEVIVDRGFSRFTSLNPIDFGSNIHPKHINGSCERPALCQIEIPRLVEIIAISGFWGSGSLGEVILRSTSPLMRIEGFRTCTSLGRIEIPRSVEMIAESAYVRCTTLIEVLFALDGHPAEIDGFGECTSLRSIEIPLSVQAMHSLSFDKCRSLRAVVFSRGSQLKNNVGFRGCRAFLAYNAACLGARGAGRIVECRLCRQELQDRSRWRSGGDSGLSRRRGSRRECPADRALWALSITRLRSIASWRRSEDGVGHSGQPISAGCAIPQSDSPESRSDRENLTVDSTAMVVMDFASTIWPTACLVRRKVVSAAHGLLLMPHSHG
jgi:hypothetical protein